MRFYLTNRKVAWEMPYRVGERFHAGTYLLPAGWHLISLSPAHGLLPKKSWWQHQDGYWMRGGPRRKKKEPAT